MLLGKYVKTLSLCSLILLYNINLDIGTLEMQGTALKRTRPWIGGTGKQGVVG